MVHSLEESYHKTISVIESCKIGIILGLIAISLSIYFNKQQQINNNLIEGDVQHLQDALLALQKELTQYQVNTERKNKELEDAILIKAKEQDKNLTKLTKALPSIIGKVVGQIEFAQDKLNRKM